MANAEPICTNTKRISHWIQFLVQREFNSICTSLMTITLQNTHYPRYSQWCFTISEHTLSTVLSVVFYHLRTHTIHGTLSGVLPSTYGRNNIILKLISFIQSSDLYFMFTL